MTADKKHRFPSIRGALDRFRTECAKEIEALGKMNENMNNPARIPSDGKDAGRQRE